MGFEKIKSEANIRSDNIRFVQLLADNNHARTGNNKYNFMPVI